MKNFEIKFYIFVLAMIFIAFNGGFMVFDYQNLWVNGKLSILPFIGLFIHSSAIVITIIFCALRIADQNKKEN